MAVKVIFPAFFKTLSLEFNISNVTMFIARIQEVLCICKEGQPVNVLGK